MMNKRISRRAGLRGLVAVAILAAGVGTLELTFGSWLAANPWDRALALNIIVDRTRAYDASGLYADAALVTNTRDRYGLRGRYGTPKDITVLTVGGSTTAQRYIADGMTWQDELQRRLRAAGKPATVANAGVDGHSTFGHLASYRDWFPLIPNLRPTYTILYVGINDVFLVEPSIPFEGATDGAPTMESRIKANSAMFRLYALMRGTLLAQRIGVGHLHIDLTRVRYVATPRAAGSEAIGRTVASAFEGRFQSLLGKVREAGSIPVCVTQPTWYYRRAGPRLLGADVDVFLDEPASAGSLNGVDYFQVRRQLDRTMLDACRAAGVPAIDLASAEWEEADFYDFVHMTPRGVTTVGRRLAAAMRDLPWPSPATLPSPSLSVARRQPRS